MQSTWAAALFGDREDPRVRLHALHGGPPATAGQPPAAALDWAERILAEADPGRRADALTATRLLRRADRRLGLRPAVFLAEHAVARRRRA
ncbi:hypothetical protein C5E16_15900 [Clavibacter michiganensis]|uniref:Uncharacterized protein n=1 Tax=Clavibacter michiganensis TaxID=28447 RepID=A0A2S5VJF9_9MICO|nr:hypothetical protein [Clavibacter michiganensis]PPF62740.1 hypothetical protein C5E16_15900 [Clavibacter michiganensis]